MPARIIPAAHPPRWTVYGRRFDKIERTGRMSMAGVHKEGCHTEEEAVAFAMQTRVLYPSASLVVVRLAKGEDKNGEREVIVRINDGRAWWE